MGSKVVGLQRWKAVLFSVSVIIIIVLVSNLYSKQAAAKASDFTIEDGVLTKYLGYEKEIVIPKGVKTIGKAAFLGCTMTKVTLPDSIAQIQEEAFKNCKNLIEIVIPDNVWGIEESAFKGCSSLHRVELSDGLHVGMSAFEDCTSLKEVFIPDGITSISHYAFKNCSSLEFIDLPDSISFIGGGCFENCINLETILFPTQDAFIGDRAFHNTLWLNNYEGDYVVINHTLIQYRGNKTDIKIPNNITVIGYGAFRNCSFINNVSIPEGVLEIGVAAFAGCTGLKIIDLPDSIVRVWAQAFYGCSNLEKITIPENVDIRRDSLEGTKWMNDYKGDFVILKGNLLAYQGTDSRVVIPDQVTTVCTGAFFDNDYVTEITIPAKVTKLAYAAFNSCDNLEKIFISNNNIYLEYETFLMCNKELTLYGVIGGPVEDYAKQNNLQFISYGINKKKVTLYLEGNHTTVLKANGLNGTVSWKSENSSIAKVNSSGKVTAVKEGTTKIMATANDITLECKIVVKLPYISKKTVSISKGHTARLNIIGVTSEITWSSSNKSVATVSKTGVVTAKNVGAATITATVNGKKYICKVTVNS